MSALATTIAACACGSAGRSPASGAAPATTNGDDPALGLTAEEKKALAALSPATLPAPPADVTNHWADSGPAAALGQKLFFDPSFSGELLDGDNDGSANTLGTKGDTGKVACAGCHLPQSGFSDTRTIRQQTSLAAGWGIRRAPSLLDVAQSKLLMWDGRRDALYNQIFGVIESPVEMNSSRLYAAEQVFQHHRADYEALFGTMPPLDDGSRFPQLGPKETGCRKLTSDNTCVDKMRGQPGDGADFDGLASEDQDAVTRVVVNVGKALGAYERLLDCGPSRFDSWIHGDASALSDAEQRGATLFVGRAKCATCHSGPFMSDEKFHNVGVRPELVATVFLDKDDPGAMRAFPLLETDPLNTKGSYSDGDDGRIPTDVPQAYNGAFRTPRLRCVASRPSFMHTGQLTSLDDVVSFFTRGGDVGGYLGTSEIAALDLNDGDRADLVAFLQALSGPGPASSLLAAP